ncbi:MAG TPA: IS1380 family transposase [Candidatus Hydrogenedentes bacterium]|nr:IS1380 family transposase [Candidatus Hydrogenedentota bacterium]
MRTKTPLLEKTPFAIDSNPMQGALTANAGLAAVSRVLRSLELGPACERHLAVKQRNRGFEPAQVVESLVLLHAAGGDCMRDIEILRQDTAMEKMLGYVAPSPRAVGDFLARFHDEDKLEAARVHAARQERLAFIVEENAALQGLQEVQCALLRQLDTIAPLPRVATVDQDATIIKSRKREASSTYKGIKGYQPMVAAWAEAELVVADEFRDGNVPAQMAPLNCAKQAFAALPHEMDALYFRGDSACHEAGLINWLRDEEREGGPCGFIGFALSARMSVELAQTLRAVPEAQWKTFGHDRDGTVRQWSELDFVPGEKTEKKDTQPLRYAGLRLSKAQGELFGDGNEHHYHAILSNRWDMDGGELIDWNRAKAGTIEHVHDEIKNGLGAGQLPSAKLGANAAWFRIACIAYNIMSALRQAWPDPSVRHAQPKRLRLVIFSVAGRFARDRRKISLRLAAPRQWIRNLIGLFEAFPLITRSTG